MTFEIKIIPVFAAFLLAAAPAFASDASQWDQGAYSKARLIANYETVPDGSDMTLFAGFQVVMGPDWKTYWRSPGDAGQPPVFDWTGSVNVANVEILYPIPDRFEIFDLQTYGYHDRVVYPILVTPSIPGAPVTLKATVNYLVCKDLCVPVKTELSLVIPAGDGPAAKSPEAGLLEKALALVPKRSGKAIQVSSLHVTGIPGDQNLVVRLKGEKLLTGADVIVEDLKEFRFGVPTKRILPASNEAEFIIPISANNPNGDLMGKALDLTLEDGWGNYEEKTVMVEAPKSKGAGR